MHDITRKVFEVLERYEIRYWLEGGSLLGALRYQDLISWDYDVDIGVYRDDLKKLFVFEDCEREPIKDERGFVWVSVREYVPGFVSAAS